MMIMIISVIVGIGLERILHVTDKLFGWMNKTSDKNS